MSIRFPQALAAALLGVAAVTAPAMAAEAIAPIQAVVATVGEQSVLAYYTSSADGCALTMMVDKALSVAEDDAFPGPAGVRVQVDLGAGTTAAVDAATGERLAFTCGQGGRMTVERGLPTQKLASR